MWKIFASCLQQSLWEGGGGLVGEVDAGKLIQEPASGHDPEEGGEFALLVKVDDTYIQLLEYVIKKYGRWC